MFGKPKWYKVAYKAYIKKKLDEPYRTLLRYYMKVGGGTPIAHYEGHYDFFAMEKWDDAIDTTTKTLRTILPEHLLNNYLSALEAYKSLGEDPEYEKVMAAFEKQDEYVWEHCDEMVKILADYVTEMTDRKVF